ncbi:MAG: hypothetical protein FJZ01_25715 [Candidatus Sericytochromatia bacterium]|nr:hypothetical protein [Candidatus Tanganyikabacteria bacterium]
MQRTLILAALVAASIAGCGTTDSLTATTLADSFAASLDGATAADRAGFGDRRAGPGGKHQAPPKLSREEAFARFDADGSGGLSLTELQSGLKSLAPPRQEREMPADLSAEQQAEWADRKAEMDARRAEHEAGMTERLATDFAKWDTDGDGLLSGSEFELPPPPRLDRPGHRDR